MTRLGNVLLWLMCGCEPNTDMILVKSQTELPFGYIKCGHLHYPQSMASLRRSCSSLLDGDHSHATTSIGYNCWLTNAWWERKYFKILALGSGMVQVKVVFMLFILVQPPTSLFTPFTQWVSGPIHKLASFLHSPVLLISQALITFPAPAPSTRWIKPPCWDRFALLPCRVFQPGSDSASAVASETVPKRLSIK